VFLLIGKTSALTMNIAGVIKDWMLIFFSYYIFQAPVTRLNLCGYAFCCTGVAIYNYQKLQVAGVLLQRSPGSLSLAAFVEVGVWGVSSWLGGWRVAGWGAGAGRQAPALAGPGVACQAARER
jgi:hypothetical protein